VHLKVYAALFGHENWAIPSVYGKIRIGTVDGEWLKFSELYCLFEQKAVGFVENGLRRPYGNFLV